MQVVGLDFAQEMLDDADARQASQAYGIRRRNANIQWVQGDAMQLPFPDCSFDAATMGYGLRNVPDVLQALKVSGILHAQSTTARVSAYAVILLTVPKRVFVRLSSCLKADDIQSPI
jgi:protein-L-isoaspartate O-methyltransferase